MYLVDICQGFIDVVHIIHLHDMRFGHSACQNAIWMLGSPLLQIVGQVRFPDQALADAVAAGMLLTCDAAPFVESSCTVIACFDCMPEQLKRPVLHTI